MIKVFYTGHLGQSPRLKETENTQILNLSVATKRRVKRDGEWQDETMWIDTALFGRNAKWLSERLQKGAHVAVSGELGMRTYTARDGTLRAQLECTADHIEPLDKRQEGAASSPPATQQNPFQPFAPPDAQVHFDDSDDIPF